jgi:hypothetical protein
VTKLEEKTIELEERLRLSRLFADVTKALMHGGTLRENLQQCSEAIVQRFDAAFAHVWTYNDREKVLELQASAGTSVQIDGPGLRAPVGEFKIDLTFTASWPPAACLAITPAGSALEIPASFSRRGFSAKFSAASSWKPSSRLTLRGNSSSTACFAVWRNPSCSEV